MKVISHGEALQIMSTKLILNSLIIEILIKILILWNIQKIIKDLIKFWKIQALFRWIKGSPTVWAIITQEEIMNWKLRIHSAILENLLLHFQKICKRLKKNIIQKYKPYQKE
jgi:hypothetical protein